MRNRVSSSLSQLFTITLLALPLWGLSLQAHALDTDLDSMDDGWEEIYGLIVGYDDSAEDNDGDSLTNLQEYIAGTKPNHPDSDFDGVQDGTDVWPADNTRARDMDADGMSDDWEQAHGLSVGFDDSLDDLDGDGLNNSQEYAAKTNPERYDTDRDDIAIGDANDAWPNNNLYNTDVDSDSLPDRFEILNSPPYKTLPPYLNYNNNPNDATQDDDGDTLSNVQEFNLGTDWTQMDTDGDGFDDNIDFVPLNAAYTVDTDGDGLPNEYEIEKGLDPNMVETGWMTDEDADGLTNLQEYLLGTEPTFNCFCDAWDTDSDGLSDGEDRYPLDPNEQQDWDMDGMPDNWENNHGLSPAYNDGNIDLDADGLKNLYEYLTGTDPQQADSDWDGVQDGEDIWPSDNTRGEDNNHNLVPDGWEYAHGLPWYSVALGLLDDDDGDGLYDWQEYDAQTNPNKQDSDNDGLNDGMDKWPTNNLYNTDTDNDGLPDRFEMLNAPPFKTIPPFLDYNYASDATEDEDGDMLSNVEEFNLGTDWTQMDSDGDGFDDNIDVVPLNVAYTVDTDGDGLPDEYEFEKGLNPNIVETGWMNDDDADGLTNLQEYLLGTEPTFNCFCDAWDTDSDGLSDREDRYPLDANEQQDWDLDGMPDNWENDHGLFPGSNDGFNDPDGDGLSNLYEYLNGAHPQHSDSDWDGVQDGEDVWPADNTKGKDLDYDLLPDGWETAHGLVSMPGPLFLFDDEDGDGLYDWQEYEAQSNPRDQDSDNDDLNDGMDKWPTNNLYNIDTDNDGLPDRFEMLNAPPFKSTPPFLSYNYAGDATQDADGDTLSNVQEFNLGTDWTQMDSDGDGFDDNIDVVPLNAAYTIDTDGDGLPDEYEIEKGLDPYVVETGWMNDDDADGLTNLQEYRLGTEPTFNCFCDAWDSDGDGLSDREDRYPLDANEQRDLDLDGMPDNWELNYSLSPGYNDGFYDTDSDGLSNLYEYLAGTNPQKSDSDWDGVQDGDDVWPADNTKGKDLDYDLLPDGWEMAHGLSIMPGPLFLFDDEDGDGLYDWQEYAAQSNPNDQDSDNDGLNDGADAWPADARYSVDSDNDGLPDAYEQAYAPPSKTMPPFLDYNYAGDATQDADGDTLSNVQEFNLGTDWTQMDTDGDGFDDNVDVVPLNAAYSVDTDGDGLPDEYEIEKGLDPNMVETGWMNDDDLDGLTNLQEYLLGTEPSYNCYCDAWDSDGDGLMDGEDRYPLDPLEQMDWDLDGMPDNWEGVHGLSLGYNDGFGDPDFDTVTNLYEYLGGSDPQLVDSDGDGYNDAVDLLPANPDEHLDSDGDGVGDGSDTFPNNPVEQFDTDMDGVGNNADTDDDNDGVLDIVDAFPLDPTETADNDLDGIGDNADTDDDNDGTPDITDNCPLIAGSQLDTDSDGLGNVCDSDDDNDGVADTSDMFPLNLAASVDTDSDGHPNSWNAACNASCQAASGLVLDNCPVNANPDQQDEDGNGVGDVCQSNGPGKLDASFTASASYHVYDVALQPDQKIIIGGYFVAVNGTPINRIARLNSNGSLDASFNVGTGANDVIKTLELQPDGKVVVAGLFTTVNGSARSKIARLNANGSLDTGFNPGTGANGTIETIALQADGKIIIGGGFTTFNGVARNRIARLNADGSLDTGFNPGSGTNNTVMAVVAQPDGKIVIGGYFTTFNGTGRNYLARLNADASLDTGFNIGTGMNTNVFALTLQADGKIIVGGSFTSVSGTPINRIARLNSNGSLDASFNVGSGVLYSYVQTAFVQPDGKIIIGGAFTLVNGVTKNYLARLNANGSLDYGFNPGGIGFSYAVRSIVPQADGKLVIAGEFASFNGSTKNYILRIHSGDADVDAIGNASDNCTYVANLNQLDTDGDKQGDACDTDDDNDGVLDVNDAFPLNAAESVDTDIDGIGNNTDTDDDNDLMPDIWETANGFNTLVNDGAGDADSDGYSNWEEYKAGTNPQDAGSHPLVSVKNDFNDDGIAGWIWLGDSNGVETQSQNWQLTFPLYSANWGVPNRFYTPIFPDQANWELVTTGDFNNDGDADMLWRHLTLATWKVWQMQNGLRVAQSAPADFDLAHDWTVVGAGDTDKDGDDDVILNKTSTGDVMIWEMHNHAIANTHSVGSKAGYTLNRIGDFNKDGDVDLLFRQNSADVLITWELQGNAFVTERALANTGTDYHPVCSGDFDNDGDDDIMFVNSTTQQEKWFVMENYTRTQTTGSTNVGFVFKGCGDYDGDGDMDSFWQRSADDANRVILQQNYGAIKQTVYTNAFGGVNPAAGGYGFVFRGNSN